MPVDGRKIEESVLLPVAKKFREILKSDPEAWTDYECSQIRSECGVRWTHVPLENVRRQCCNLRKRALLGTLGKTKNHGRTKKLPPPAHYLEYLQSEWWRAFRRKVLEFWEYRCAYCYGEERLDVHHRCYDRLHCEKLNDCLVLCRDCHDIADRGRARRKKNEQAELYA